MKLAMSPNHVSRFALVLLLLFFARAPAQSMFGDTPGDNPSFGLYAAETGGGLLLGAVGAAGLFYGLASAWVDTSDDSENQGVAWFFSGLASYVIAYPVGCAAGTSIVGGLKQQDGSPLLSYLGALVGVPVGYGVFFLGEAASGGSAVIRWPAVALGLLAPPVGATIGYNLSRKSGVGYGLLDQRLLMPSIGLRCEPAGEETAVALDMKLLNVRF